MYIIGANDVPVSRKYTFDLSVHGFACVTAKFLYSYIFGEIF